MASSTTVPSKVLDYHVLPINLPPLPSYPTPATHYLYLKPHEPKIPDPKTPRSLFLVNVPFDSTDTHIKHLFSAQLGLPGGRIEEICFDDPKRRIKRSAVIAPQSQLGKKGRKRKRDDGLESSGELEGAEFPETWDRELHRSGSSAVVIFVDRPSMEATVKAVRRLRKQEQEIIWGDGVEGKVPELGSQRYLTHHKLRYPDRDVLLESVNKYMTAYANQEAARSRMLARKRQEPDEDGFITVTRGGRTGPARHEDAQEKLEKQKEKHAGLDDFYRFQSREKRKEKAVELIRKFEEDKEKVRKMKERRGRFKPE